METRDDIDIKYCIDDYILIRNGKIIAVSGNDEFGDYPRKLCLYNCCIKNIQISDTDIIAVVTKSNCPTSCNC